MFYIYILLSECSGYYYIGHSDDPERRLFQHNNIDKDTYTSKHRPWSMVFKYPVSDTRSDAIIIEKYLKKRKSKTLLKKLALKQNDNVFLEKFFKKILATANATL
jgi:putative endonuclease